MVRFLTLAAVALLSACGERREIVIDDVEIARNGWDTLLVEPSFVSISDFGASEAVSPDTVGITIFDSAFDTLYVGSGRTVILDDASLSDREKILVEVCGAFGAFKTCDQAFQFASEKRVSLEPTVSYPIRDDYARGSFNLRYAVERKLADSSLWEPVNSVQDLDLMLSVEVLGTDGGRISVPLASQRGSFSLRSHRNWDDYQYELMSQLVDSSKANVQFKILDPAKDQVLAELTKEIVSKSEQTRELEVGLFVEEAGRRLLNRLRTFRGGTERFVFLNDWSYLTAEKRYIIQIELAWRSAYIRSRFFRLQGQLEVEDTGRNATFTVTDGNDRGKRRWRSRFEGSTVHVGDLHTIQLPTGLELGQQSGR